MDPMPKPSARLCLVKYGRSLRQGEDPAEGGPICSSITCAILREPSLRGRASALLHSWGRPSALLVLKGVSPALRGAGRQPCVLHQSARSAPHRRFPPGEPAWSPAVMFTSPGAEKTNMRSVCVPSAGRLAGAILFVLAAALPARAQY